MNIEIGLRDYHAIFMAAAFALLLPIGALTARYGQSRVFASKEAIASSRWFHAHLVFQITGIPLAKDCLSKVVYFFFLT